MPGLEHSPANASAVPTSGGEGDPPALSTARNPWCRLVRPTWSCVYTRGGSPARRALRFAHTSMGPQQGPDFIYWTPSGEIPGSASNAKAGVSPRIRRLFVTREGARSSGELGRGRAPLAPRNGVTFDAPGASGAFTQVRNPAKRLRHVARCVWYLCTR